LKIFDGSQANRKFSKFFYSMFVVKTRASGNAADAALFQTWFATKWIFFLMDRLEVRFVLTL
jgi:hypothetical protein